MCRSAVPFSSDTTGEYVHKVKVLDDGLRANAIFMLNNRCICALMLQPYSEYENMFMPWRCLNQRFFKRIIGRSIHHNETEPGDGSGN